MAIDPSTAQGLPFANTATQGTPGGGAAQSAMSKLSGDYESFLKLLTAQVANQDPLAPMDSTTFVTQLAQLSQVEQSVQTNSNLEDIAARLGNVSAMADMQLIGREVTLPTQMVELRDGAGRYQYELARAADEVDAVIRSADGTEIRRITGLPTEGETRLDMVWDGLDNAGLPVPDDTFTVEIEARDAEGERISYAGVARTGVESVEFVEGQGMLTLRNGEVVPSAQLWTIHAGG
ncbi:flagellar hook assembly protein FlgD [Mesobaculum littorinae]|uniref:flagellar hook assembly protein FlgD n=1 Tax=Mesobaculum littorinae TaxID=2486419 RepID=UPI0013E385DF|nr:flagellar hook assembly protein FlgD [Mesobaculum littorinae]